MAIDFASLNFETLDANLNAYPDMFINQSGVTFTKKVMEDMGYPAYVLCQLDVKNRVFAVRMCKSNEQRAFKFSKSKTEQKSTVSINSKNVTEAIRETMKGNWMPDKRYRVRGFWVADAKTMCFDLSEATQESFRAAAAEEGADE